MTRTQSHLRKYHGRDTRCSWCGECACDCIECVRCEENKGPDKYEHTRTEDICWDCIEAESESNPHRFPKRRQLPEHREP